MFKEITSIDLFDLNVGMTCANVRLRCSKISPVLIYLIKIGMWYVAMMFMNIAGIDLFDQNVGMACANIRLRCSWISLVLIYLIKMWV